MRRKKVVNKRKAAKSFNRSVQKVKLVNVAPPPQRGGYRL